MSKEFPYQDENLSFKERAADLVSRMTVEEAAEQLKFDAPAIPRLGIPAYNWWNEALHGVARAGVATVFPQAIALAAVFDKNFMRSVAETISTEGRAKYNESIKQGDHDIYKGLTFWSPNVNIFRDPRWGRGHETYGEDPYLTSRLGVEFVKGLQGDGKHLKSAACAKHYAVHSGPEEDRHHFDAIASQQDMADTYMPAFKALVQEANVEAVMGAYNRTNGEPCCGSKTLLLDILRDEWGFDGHVVSDCWAIKDFHTGHNVTKTAPESAAYALKNGCDINCGNTYIHLLAALEEKLITEDDIKQACIRAMTTRMRLGMFDENCEFNSIPFEANDTAENHALALEAAKKSMVLLKNDGVLPLDKSLIKNIAVVGPNADSVMALKANYSGTPSRYYTLLEGIRTYLGDDVKVWYSQGSHLFKRGAENLGMADDRLAEATAMAQRSDAVIVCVGLDATVEGEQGDMGTSNIDAGGDKTALELPNCQINLINAMLKTGKPVIVAVCAGSSVVLGEGQADKANAVLHCWYPGQMGGLALAKLLFGEESFSGRLPVTFYKSTAELPDFSDYAMDNRTYRYIKNEPLYPFGYGLSYVGFEYSSLNLKDSIAAGDSLEVSVNIKNTGTIAADEVVELYIRDEEASVRTPNVSLCGFERVYLNPGESKTVSITVSPWSMEVCGLDGSRFIEPGEFTVFAGGSQPDALSEKLTGKKCLSAKFNVR